MEVKKVWYPDPKEGWLMGDVKRVAGKLLSIQTASGEMINHNMDHTAPSDGEPEVVEDLIRLDDLTEGSLLWVLKLRYNNQPVPDIYTYIGQMVISVNPFQNLPIYGREVLEQYRGASKDSLPPHLFSVANSALENLLQMNESQSVVISGESGSGKTEATKVVLQFLTTVAPSERDMSGDLASRILATNPVLEAFGNAKTVRNGNSSRFGKFIKIAFSGGKIIGAKVDNYLLEKTRIVKQAPTERNYHIFYQLLLGSNEQEKKKYFLLPVTSYKYITNGLVVVPGADDAANWSETKQALRTLGISPQEIDSFFSVLSAILHLGNIEFSESGDKAVIKDNSFIKYISALLCLSQEHLETTLTVKTMVTAGDAVKIPLTVEQATENRDSFCKMLYSKLFDLLIKRINSHLVLKKGFPTGSKFIGVLDIYGFENFAHNSLEQLCINFTNEKLHSQFNKVLFKLEQEEYAREGIEWTPIRFIDNSDTVALIERPPLGLFQLLDDEGKMPRANDLTFALAISKKHAKHLRFEVDPRFSNLFTIKHYAEPVTYNVEGFLEKNKDNMTTDILKLICEAKSEFIKELFKVEIKELEVASKVQAVQPRSSVRLARGSVAGQGMKNSVTRKFVQSLQELVDTLDSCNLHYVRCIKPNDTASPNQFEGSKVLTQLRSNGVLETVKLRKSGFARRMPFDDFTKRYACLGCNSSDEGDIILFLEEFLEPEDATLGQTKIFLKSAAVECLEAERQVLLEKSVVVLQSYVRQVRAIKFVEHRRILSKNAIVLQTSIRRFNAFITLQRLIQYRRVKLASTVMQKYIRARLTRAHYEPIINKRIEEKRRREREEKERKEREERERKEKEERERREREEKERKEREEKERKEREAREKKEREERERREKEERERKEKEERERKEKEERERKEREERERKEREERERKEKEERERKEKEEKERKEKERLEKIERDRIAAEKKAKEEEEEKERQRVLAIKRAKEEEERLEREQREKEEKEKERQRLLAIKKAKEEEEKLEREQREKEAKEKKERELAEKRAREKQEQEEKEQREKEAKEKRKRELAEQKAREEKEKQEREEREKKEQKERERKRKKEEEAREREALAERERKRLEEIRRIEEESDEESSTSSTDSEDNQHYAPLSPRNSHFQQQQMSQFGNGRQQMQTNPLAQSSGRQQSTLSFSQQSRMQQQAPPIRASKSITPSTIQMQVNPLAQNRAQQPQSEQQSQQRLRAGSIPRIQPASSPRRTSVAQPASNNSKARNGYERGELESLEVVLNNICESNFIAERIDNSKLDAPRYLEMLKEEWIVDLASAATLDASSWDAICNKGFPILLRQCLVNEHLCEVQKMPAEQLTGALQSKVAVLEETIKDLKSQLATAQEQLKASKANGASSNHVPVAVPSPQPETVATEPKAPSSDEAAATKSEPEKAPEEPVSGVASFFSSWFSSAPAPVKEKPPVILTQEDELFFGNYKTIYLRGDYETPQADAVVLAAMLLQVEYGDAKQVQKNVEQYLPFFPQEDRFSTKINVLAAETHQLHRSHLSKSAAEVQLEFLSFWKNRKYFDKIIRYFVYDYDQQQDCAGGEFILGFAEDSLLRIEVDPSTFKEGVVGEFGYSSITKIKPTQFNEDLTLVTLNLPRQIQVDILVPAADHQSLHMLLLHYTTTSNNAVSNSSNNSSPSASTRTSVIRRNSTANKESDSVTSSLSSFSFSSLFSSSPPPEQQPQPQKTLKRSATTSSPPTALARGSTTARLARTNTTGKTDEIKISVLLGEKDKTPRPFTLPYTVSIHATCVNIAKVLGINIRDIFENTFGLKYTKSEITKFLEPSVIIGKQITSLRITSSLTFATRLFHILELPQETSALWFMFGETISAIGTGMWRVYDETTMAKLAALHLQAQHSDWTPNKTPSALQSVISQFVPDMWIDIPTKLVIELYQKCRGKDKWQAIREYLSLAMSLYTYGECLYPVTMGNTNYFLAINADHVSVVNNFNAETKQSWALNEVKVIARDKCVFMLTQEYEMEFYTPDHLEVCELIEDYQELYGSNQSTCSMM